MAKCTGMRCPMQQGYKVEECNHMDCPYRTEPITNADRIRAMSDGELAEYLVALVDDEFRGNVIYSKQEVDWIEWLKQPARTPLEGDVLLEDMAVFSSAQQAAERRGEEAFTCPLCGGTAWWGRSKTNGHLHCGCNDCHFKLME